MKMKKILITLLLLVATTFAAQAQQPNLDSLYAVWQDQTQTDSIRTAAYNNYIWKGFLFSNPDTAFTLAEELVVFGLEKQYPIAQTDGYSIQGGSFYAKGNYPKALEYFDRSLKISEEIGNKVGIAKVLNNIGSIYKNQSNYPKALEYYQRSLKIQEEIGDKSGIAGVLTGIGVVYFTQSNYPKALEYYQRSVKIKEEIGDKSGIADVLNNIGIIYNIQSNYPKALEYYERSVKIREEIGDKRRITSSLINIGHIYLEKGDYPNALDYYQRGIKICEETGQKQFQANALIGIGSIYKNQSNYPKALEYCQRSLKIYEEIGAKDGIAIALYNIGDIYNKESKHQDAIIQCKKSLEISEDVGSIEQQRSACNCLYDAHKGLKNWQKALEYFELEQQLTDSLKADETNKDLQRFEFDRKILRDSIGREKEKREIEVAHQKEITEKNKIQYTAIGGGALVMLLAIGLFARLRYTNKTKKIIEKEKDRSDKLLLNILPAEVAEELKNTGESEAKHFDEVSILFTDFKGFTQASELLSAKDLVNEINTCFKAFDNICEKYGIEKIKTIGDAYMAAAGLGHGSKDKVLRSKDAFNMVSAALEMQQFMMSRNQELLSRNIRGERENSVGFTMRAGINTGPVVAGIVGVKKFQYDIWGDTVNTASRMESSGEVGKVNISESTYQLLKDDTDFKFESRGHIEAKGKGEIEMYFVSKA
jgi:adenylate cyclase